MGAIIKDGGCSLRFRDVGGTFSVLNDRYIPPHRSISYSPGKISNDGNTEVGEGGERGINEAIMTCKSSMARRPCN